jgi:hypothetical protein
MKIECDGGLQQRASCAAAPALSATLHGELVCPGVRELLLHSYIQQLFFACCRSRVVRFLGQEQTTSALSNLR